MRRAKSILVITAALTPFSFLAVSGQQAASGQHRVTIVPEETDELLANPGMGWQTFHRTKDQDKNLPEWVPSTIHYARWSWGDLEPEPGEINYAFLDQILKAVVK